MRGVKGQRESCERAVQKVQLLVATNFLFMRDLSKKDSFEKNISVLNNTKLQHIEVPV